MKKRHVPEWLLWTWVLTRVLAVFIGLSCGVTPGLVLFLILFPHGLRDMLS